MTPLSSPDDDAWTVRAWIRDVHISIATLTRLPVPAPDASALLSPRARRAWPLVGAFTGLAAGGVFFAAHDVGLPLVVCTVLCVASLILIGGHVDDHGQRAAAPLLVATMIKLAAIYVLGNPATTGGGSHMVVLALAAAGALSQAGTLLLEPDALEEDSETHLPEETASDPKVIIMPPDGTQIPEDGFDEGNGRAIGPAATAVTISLLIAFAALGLLPGAVAIGGAALGAWIAPRLLRRDIEDGALPMTLAQQQSGEVWALLGLAVLMSV